MREERQEIEEAEATMKMNENTPERSSSSGCNYKTFMNTRPSEFHGVSDPIIVTNWLTEMETIFRILQCTETQKVLYATTILKGEALHWWDVLTITLGDEVVKKMTWEQFKKNIQEKYCLQSRIDMDLQQGAMTLQERNAELFAERRMQRYINGLKMSIVYGVSMTNPTSFQKVVKAASKVEREFNRQCKYPSQLKRKLDDKSSKSNKAQTFGVGPKQKLTTSEKYQEKMQKRRRLKCYLCKCFGHLVSECPSREKVCFSCQSGEHLFSECPSKKIVCFSCRSPEHLVNECPKKKFCFSCQSRGHMAVNCPKKNNEARSRQKKICFSCQSQGHMAVNCPKKNNEARSRQKEGKSCEPIERETGALEVKRRTYQMTVEDAQTSQNVA